MTDVLTVRQLTDRLAEVSHDTYVRQKAEDLRRAARERADQIMSNAEAEVAALSSEVTEHDRERAGDAVRALVDLGLWPPSR
jgi:hypothetical protein